MTTIPETKYLKDYKVPDYLIPNVELDFEILKHTVIVKSKLSVKRNIQDSTPLKLNGKDLDLKSVKVDSKELPKDEYSVQNEILTIFELPEEFTLEITTEIDPWENKSLEGLYKSGNILCTQCESEGFRRVTYFLDRPDVMSIYTTTVTADKQEFPLLLSNGNLTKKEDLGTGRHKAQWQDPFPKPCYLFALVAGDLGEISDTYTTASGKVVDIKFYVDKGNEPRATYAVDALKRSMKWDEDTFGLECDLDIYMVVAVDAFNAGAMENKGLNIFNSKYVLADQESATDSDYEGIEGVIGHEYFHNWTGNRVTCRDWFQLTLKEGLTVFRDQEFSSDMTSRAVKRISDVQCLRESQFPEDAGPMSHPIRPASYIKMDNFYTSTVYNKGSEVIRMVHTLIGAESFRKGIDKYFELYDGQAVTTDDFINAMELASDKDLTQFKNWYSQNGTPTCEVTSNYDPKAKQFSLTVKQSCVPFKDGTGKAPFHFPVKLGLINKEGVEIPIEQSEKEECSLSPVIEVTQAEETFVFDNIESKPVPSLLRDFSAPVKLKYDYTQEELIFLLANDTNEFARYDSGQQLLLNYLRAQITRKSQGQEYIIDSNIFDALGKIIKDTELDRAFCAKTLVPPTLNGIVDQMDICDFHAAFEAREFFMKELAVYHEAELLKFYEESKSVEYSTEPQEIAKRSFKNTCLSYLAKLDNKYTSLIFDQFENSKNMTDSIASLAMLVNVESDKTEKALNAFYERWKEDSLVINKWFAVQASSKLDSVFEAIEKLENNAVFDKQNPNKIRSLYGVFSGNLINFHAKSGKGYKLITDKIIEIDKFNPQIAARLAGAYKKYAKLPADLKSLMKLELERIIQTENISSGLFEVVSKTINN